RRVTEPSGARVLVVDDEPAILRVVQTNLSGHGFRVDTAATGQEALEAAGRVRPDLVLLDLGLPDMDGVDVIRLIRERAATPIVVLSARGAEHDEVAAPDLGAVWRSASPSQAHSLHVHVARLRKKLGVSPTARRHLLTAPGVGYRFVTEGS